MVTALVVALCSAANPDLDRARAAYTALDFKATDAALDAALKRAGNTRDDLLDILQLQGTVAGMLGQAPRATKVFLTLLTLDPSRRIGDDAPPRVSTPFFEARGRQTDSGKLELKPVPAQVEGGKTTLSLEVKDPLGLVRQYRFHVRLAGQATWSTINSQQPSTVATADVDWWVEALGELEAQLMLAGSANDPLKTGPAKVADAPPPPPPIVVASPAKPMSGGRIGGIVLGVAGLGALGGGIGLGLNATALHTRLSTLPVDGSGNVTGITQKDAYDLEAQQRTSALVANVLFVASAGLVAAGVVVFAVSGSSGDVALVPSVGGASLVGRF